MLSGKLSVAFSSPGNQLYAFGRGFGPPRWAKSREAVDMTAFCSPLKGVFNSRPRAVCNEPKNRDFAKKPKESNYHASLNQGQLACILPIGSGEVGGSWGIIARTFSSFCLGTVSLGILCTHSSCSMGGNPRSLLARSRRHTPKACLPVQTYSGTRLGLYGECIPVYRPPGYI